MWQKYVTHYHCLLKCYTEETANFSYILVHEGWYLQPFFFGGGGGQYVHVHGVRALNAYIALVFIDQEIIHT